MTAQWVEDAAWWVEFENRRAACVQAATAEAATAAAQNVTGCKVTSVRCLPYPASPILVRVGTCPPFCWQPEKCAGRRACPRPRACDD